MPSAEFTDWIAYSSIEHFGYPMDNYRMGVVASTVDNAINRSIAMPKGARRPKGRAVSDYYPEQKKREPELTKEQQQHIERKKRAKRKTNG